ncbi:MAG: type II secretion system protein N [Casimicrobiaceae bacterium]
MTATARGGALPLRWRMLRGAMTLAAGAVLALVVAHWGWRWLGPGPTPTPQAVEAASPAAVITATPLFGSPSTAAATAADVPVTRLAGDARLIGIIAGGDGAGYALFRFPDRGPVLVATGSEIAPGVILRAVNASGARIADRGQAREILLRPIGVTPPAAPSAALSQTPSNRPPPAAASGNANNPACVPPGGGSTAPYRLNAELLTGIAAKPESWSDAFTAGQDGLAMREGNAFGTMLGMRAGDRAAQANGVPLRGADDVLVAMIRPLLANQAVRVTGLRDGRPIEWIYVNAGACPP